MHFCNISFLGSSTLFERNVYSKVRRITLHFFPLTPAQALIKTSVTVTNSLILDYTLNLLTFPVIKLFINSNYKN